MKKLFSNQEARMTVQSCFKAEAEAKSMEQDDKTWQKAKADGWRKVKEKLSKD